MIGTIDRLGEIDKVAAMWVSLTIELSFALFVIGLVWWLAKRS